MTLSGVDPELVSKLYWAYLKNLHYSAVNSRAEGRFDLANLYEEVAHQWQSQNFTLNSSEYPGLWSACVAELVRLYPRDP